jgi:acetate kinase
MKIIAFNCGSSTLKFKCFEMDHDTPLGLEKVLARGSVDRIGGPGTVRFFDECGASFQSSDTVHDHSQATERAIDWLFSLPFVKKGGIEAIGHRIVHGGHRFSKPVLIDAEVIDAIAGLGYLAPLHNDPALASIRAARELLGTSMPAIAVFDTAFHAGMPARASLYAIPGTLLSRHHIRRYGFHGLAHRYMVDRYAAITGSSLENANIITLQLGNGCSATAIKGGCSIDTSMGFTPLEGLMMGTRSGNIDPHLPTFLARAEGVDVETVEEWLNTKSGLLGVSGLSQDMRELLMAEKEGQEGAALAVEMFCYRVRKEIGACLAVLGGADAVVFGGGIGENSPEVRRRICAGMEWCGLALDAEKNNSMIGREGMVSVDGAPMGVYVIPVDEERLIARDTAAYVKLPPSVTGLI